MVRRLVQKKKEEEEDGVVGVVVRKNIIPRYKKIICKIKTNTNNYTVSIECNEDSV